MSGSNQFSMYKSEQELEEMKVVIPSNGVKDFVIQPDGIYGMFIIKWDDGRGVLPVKLRGHFTSMTLAEKAIKKYVDNFTKPASPEQLKQDAEAEESARQASKNGLTSGENLAKQEAEYGSTPEKSPTKEKEEVKGIFTNVFGSKKKEEEESK